MITKVIVVGEDKLRLKFNMMAKDAAGPLLDLAVQAGAEMIRNEAVRRAPVESGELRRSITVSPVGKR